MRRVLGRAILERNPAFVRSLGRLRKPWRILERQGSSGKLRQAQASSGKLRVAQASSGKLREAQGSSGKFREAQVRSGYGNDGVDGNLGNA